MSCVITLSENLSYVKLSCLWAVDCLLLLFECFFLQKVLCSIVSTKVLSFFLCIWKWHSSMWVKRQINESFHIVTCFKAIDEKASDWERATLDKKGLVS